MNKPHKKTEEIRRFILENVDDHPNDITSYVSFKFDISRQAVHRHVQKLTAEGLLIAGGTTRNIKYKVKPLVDFSINFHLKGLEEDKIWHQNVRNVLNDLPENVAQICQYGFTEMVNNAIDHSEGNALKIAVKRTYHLIEMQIIDNGIGIFNKIQKELHLDNPHHAILELAKGKLTTDPQHHTGEGIFFTSRMFDRFSITSGKSYFAYIETEGDWLVENKDENLKGTAVLLRISPKSHRIIQKVYDKYTTEGDHGFSKTHIPVFLAAYGEENLISRSQAKRLSARFERFKEIVLDFENVDSIGHGFSDEIFRVFHSQNPGINLIPTRANPQVQKMIARTTGKE